MSAQTSNQALKQHINLPSLDDVIEHILEDEEELVRRMMRPQIKPVIAICGHIGRSTEHTCGAWDCTETYGC